MMIATKNQSQAFTAADILFSLYIFGEIYFSHSIIGQLLMIIFVAFMAVRLLTRRKLAICSFFAMYIFLIVWGTIQCFIGIALDVQIAGSLVITLCLNILLLLCVYNYVIVYQSVDKVLSIFENMVFISDIAILLSSAQSLFSARLGISENFNPNTLAMLSAFVVCMIINRRMSKTNLTSSAFFDVVKIFIFFAIILLSGTRKALLILIIGITILMLLKNPRRMWRNAILSLVGLVLVYYLIMNVPFLYNIVGFRVEAVFNYLQGSNYSESSLYIRSSFIKLGLEYIKERPLAGYGLNCFRLINSRAKYSHNNFIELMFSVGIIGCIVYYSSFLRLIIKSFKSRKTNAGSILMFSIIVTMVVADYGMVSYYERITLCLVTIAWASLSANGGANEHLQNL